MPNSDQHTLAVARRALRKIAGGREVREGDHTIIVDVDDPAALAQRALDEMDELTAADDAAHIARLELQEIADGAHGHGPRIRGLARDLLKRQ